MPEVHDLEGLGPDVQHQEAAPGQPGEGRREPARDVRPERRRRQPVALDDDAAGRVRVAAKVEGVELPGAARDLWVAEREALGRLPAADQKAAWRALCEHMERRCAMARAERWLRKAIAEHDAPHAPHVPSEAAASLAGAA